MKCLVRWEEVDLASNTLKLTINATYKSHKPTVCVRVCACVRALLKPMASDSLI